MARRSRKKSARFLQMEARAEFNTQLVRKTVTQVMDSLSTTKNPLIKAGLLVQKEAIQSMRKGGRSIGPRGGLKQTPSPPGKPPHVQSGTLRASIRWAKSKTRRRKNVIVGPTRQASYGKFHEHGIGKFPKRSFMRPALLRVRRKFPQMFRNMDLAATGAGRLLNSRRRRRQ